MYFTREIHNVEKQLGFPSTILSGFNAIEYMMTNADEQNDCSCCV